MLVLAEAGSKLSFFQKVFSGSVLMLCQKISSGICRSQIGKDPHDHKCASVIEPNTPKWWWSRFWFYLKWHEKQLNPHQVSSCCEWQWCEERWGETKSFSVLLTRYLNAFALLLWAPQVEHLYSWYPPKNRHLIMYALKARGRIRILNVTVWGYVQRTCEYAFKSTIRLKLALQMKK